MTKEELYHAYIHGDIVIMDKEQLDRLKAVLEFLIVEIERIQESIKNDHP